MERSKNYQTKQKQEIIDYLQSLDGSHTSVNQIVNYFKSAGLSVGITTIYRHLEKLVDENIVKKYRLDGFTGACYQYLGEIKKYHQHYHLKCEACGHLFHVECEYMDVLKSHTQEHHQFNINLGNTIFYGICVNCNK